MKGFGGIYCWHELELYLVSGEQNNRESSEDCGGVKHNLWLNSLSPSHLSLTLTLFWIW